MPPDVPRPTLRRRASVLTALAVAGAASPGAAAVDDLLVVSRATGPAGAEVEGSAPALSGDGRLVAFASSAAELTGGGARQVFARRLAEDVTLLVSRADGPAGAAGDGASGAPALSAGGRYVAFTSTASNLVPGDDNGVADVFVRDLGEGTTILVSRAAGPDGGSGDGPSSRPAISAGGRYVAFASSATDLLGDGPGPGGVAQVYVRDLRAGTTSLVSRAGGEEGAPGDRASSGPSISGDGRRVAFTSAARNLAGQHPDAPTGAYVRDLDAGTTTLVSRASGRDGTPVAGSQAVVSGDGRHVAFVSGLPGAGPAREVFIRSLASSETQSVSRGDGREGARSFQPSMDPVVSGDGRYVAFRSRADLSGESPGGGVYVRDVRAGRTALAGRPVPPGGPARGAPTMSGDGRFVAFAAGAVLRWDVLGPPAGRRPLAPGPLCAPAAGAAGPAASPRGALTLSRRQLLINQRIAQAAIRRLNAVQARLDGGLSADAICGYSIGAADLATPIATRMAASSLALATPAEPAPLPAAARRPGPRGAVELSAEQLLVNQRIGQAAVRRANALLRRLRDGLTGGDIRDAQIDQGKLASLLQVIRAPAGPAPPASRTRVAHRRGPAGPGRVRLTVGQLRVNQRVFQAAVRRANALVRRLEMGITGDQIRDGSLTAADLAPGARPPTAG